MNRSRFSESIAWALAAAVAGSAWGLSALLRMLRTSFEDLSPTDISRPGTDFLELDGQTVAYHAMGDGENTLIFLHCFAGRMETWRELQTRLTGRMRTVAFDLWGFGASSRPNDLTPDDWTRQVLGVMDRLQISSAVLAGHSMGGRVALACAAQARDRIRGVVLMGTDGIELPRGYSRLWLLAHSPLVHVAQQYLTHHPELIVKLMRESYPLDYPITRALIRLYQHPLRVRGTARALKHLGHTYHGENLHALMRQVAELACPVLLLWGSRDRVTPVHYALRLADLLPHAELVVLPHTSHLPHEEQPEMVAEHLQRFIERCGTD